MSIIGITHHVSSAPPVPYQSVRFIDTYIEIIEIILMPIAVLKALAHAIPSLISITVSKAILVSSPFTMANDMISSVGHGMPVN